MVTGLVRAETASPGGVEVAVGRRDYLSDHNFPITPMWSF